MLYRQQKHIHHEKRIKHVSILFEGKIYITIQNEREEHTL